MAGTIRTAQHWAALGLIVVVLLLHACAGGIRTDGGSTGSGPPPLPDGRRFCPATKQEVFDCCGCPTLIEMVANALATIALPELEQTAVVRCASGEGDAAVLGFHVFRAKFKGCLDETKTIHEGTRQKLLETFDSLSRSATPQDIENWSQCRGRILNGKDCHEPTECLPCQVRDEAGRCKDPEPCTDCRIRDSKTCTCNPPPDCPPDNIRDLACQCVGRCTLFDTRNDSAYNACLDDCAHTRDSGFARCQDDGCHGGVQHAYEGCNAKCAGKKHAAEAANCWGR